MEIWKDIIGYEGKYMVSSFGRIKSLAKIVGNGKGYLQSERILNLCKDSDGYLQFSLPTVNRRKKTYKVHRFVAEIFIGKIPEKAHVCHIDDNPQNNRVDNLYIGDIETNTMDRYIRGRTKLSIDNILYIRSNKHNLTQKELALMFGVRQNYINRIINRVRGVYITNK